MAAFTYYEILGVRRDADPAAIKAAYRALARQFHPDHTQDPLAEERFKAISEAYRILSDTELRTAYDRFGRAPGWAAYGPGSQLAIVRRPHPVATGLRRVVRTVERRVRSRRGDDLTVETTVTFAEAINGCRRVFELPAAGQDPAATRRLEFRLPEAMVSGQLLRWEGYGRSGTGDGAPGDLFVRVRVTPHPVLVRDGDHIRASLPLRPSEFSGAEVAVPTVLGRRSLPVPAGSRPGDVLALAGCGVPLPGGRRGDALFRLELELPGPCDSARSEAWREAERRLGDAAWPRRAAWDRHLGEVE